LFTGQVLGKPPSHRWGSFQEPGQNERKTREEREKNERRTREDFSYKQSFVPLAPPDMGVRYKNQIKEMRII
jgi:hypothetical protein